MGFYVDLFWLLLLFLIIKQNINLHCSWWCHTGCSWSKGSVCLSDLLITMSPVQGSSVPGVPVQPVVCTAGLYESCMTVGPYSLVWENVLGKKDRKRKCQKWIRDWLCVQLLVRASEEIILVRKGEKKVERWCRACMNRVEFCSLLAWLGFRHIWAWLRVPYINAVRVVDLKSRICTVALITLVWLRIHELIKSLEVLFVVAGGMFWLLFKYW